MVDVLCCHILNNRTLSASTGMVATAGFGVLWSSIQTWLFTILEDELGELDEKHRNSSPVCETCSPRAYIGLAE